MTKIVITLCYSLDEKQVYFDFVKELECEQIQDVNEDSSDWNVVEVKLLYFSSYFSYDLASHSELWERMHLHEDILEIVERLIQIDQKKLFGISKWIDFVPWYLFALRDRMMQIPETIPTIFPQYLRALQNSFSNVFIQQMIISTIAALTTTVSKKSNPVIQQTILKHIEQLLPIFSKRIQNIEEKLEKNSSIREPELDSISFLKHSFFF